MGSHRCLPAGLKSPIHHGFGITINLIVSHRGTDAGILGPSKAAGQIHIDRRILRRHSSIPIGSDLAICVGLRSIIDAIHAYRGVNGYRIRLTAGCGKRDVDRFRLGIHRHIFSRVHFRSAIDVSVGGIFLNHRQSRAAKAGLRGSALAIRCQNFPRIGSYEFFQRRADKGIRHTSGEIHGGDVGLGIHIHIAAGHYLRRCGLRFILLSDIRRGAIVVVHHRHRRRAGSKLRRAGGLGPAIHQVADLEIGEPECILQPVKHRIGFGAGGQQILIGDLCLRFHVHVARRFHIAGNKSFRVIFLLGVTDSGRHGYLRPVSTKNGFGSCRRGSHIAGTGNGGGIYSDTRSPFSLRFSAYGPCHRRFGIIFAEKEPGGRIDTHGPRLFGQVRQDRRIHGAGRKRILELRQRRRPAFSKAYEFPISAIATISFDTDCVRAVQIAGLVDGIFRLHRYIAIGIHGASHLRLCLGISNADSPGQRQHASATGHLGGELAGRCSGNLRISFAGNRSPLAYLGRHITMKLCPAEIERRAGRLGAEKSVLHQSESHLIASGSADLHILLCIKRTVVHTNMGIHMADAHVKAKAQDPAGDRRHSRTGIRADADVSVRLAGANGFDLCIFHIHIGSRSDLRG